MTKPYKLEFCINTMDKSKERKRFNKEILDRISKNSESRNNEKIILREMNRLDMTREQYNEHIIKTKSSKN